MALDRDMSYHVDELVITTTRQAFNIFESTYVLVHNTHATAIVTVYAGFTDDRGIDIPPGGFRSLPRQAGASQLWVVSDTAATTVQLLSSATKWASDFMASELSAHIDATIPAAITEGQWNWDYVEVTAAINIITAWKLDLTTAYLTAQLGRNARAFSFYDPTYDVRVSIQYADEAAFPTDGDVDSKNLVIPAGVDYSWPPEGIKVDILALHFEVDGGGANPFKPCVAVI